MRISKSERLRIFVTGATGAYGAHFAAHCLAQGHEVYAIEHHPKPNDSASLLGIKDKITWVQGDVRNGQLLAGCLADWDIQAVAHFAALPLVRTSVVVAEPVFSTNVMGTVALLDAVKQVSVGGKKIHFLHVSTDKVYGNAGDVPYTEDTPLNGSSVYEASKVAAEAACRAYQAQGHVPNLVMSRSCNVVATTDTNFRLIPNTIRQFMCNVPAKVFTSAQYVREYIHVRDSVEALYELMMRADEYAGQAFNVGSGYQWTQEEAIEHIKKAHFPEGNIIRIDPPAYHKIEISYQRLNCAKIERALGWKPRRTLEATIAELVGWWKEHRELAPWSIL